MSAFLEELGKKLAERWLELLVLPGLLWVATLGVGMRLGWSHPLAYSRVSAWLDRLGASAAHHGAVYAVTGAVAVLLASSAIGLAATLVGALINRLWDSTGDRLPMSLLVWWRRRQWHRLRERARRALTQSGAYVTGGAPGFWRGTRKSLVIARARHLELRRMAGPAERPERPTTMAERFRGTAIRMRDLYSLDLDLAWPRLWTLLPDPLRDDVSRAGAAYAASARLAAWGLLYLLLVVVWWPAFFIAAVLCATATVRARTSAGLLAELVETAVDLHLAELAGQLELADAAPLTKATGDAVTRRLRHGPPDPAAAPQIPSASQNQGS